MIAMSITSSVLIIFALKIIIWTFLLNLLCRAGYINIAWFLVLLPLIIIVVLLMTYTAIFALAVTQAQKETPQVPTISPLRKIETMGTMGIPTKYNRIINPPHV